MKINPIDTPVQIQELISRVETPKQEFKLPDTPAVQRQFEIRQDPPVTVLKFSDEKTKELLMQIPSEISIKTYQQVDAFLKKHK